MDVYHPTDRLKAISTDDFGYEPVQHLAKQLFDLPSRCTFTQVATPLDPRGYLDLYGDDPDEVYQLQNGDRKFRYRTLACFFDHISFILEGDIDCILTPEQEGIRLQLIDEGAEDPIIEKRIHTREDFINAVTSFKAISNSAEDVER